MRPLLLLIATSSAALILLGVGPLETAESKLDSAKAHANAALATLTDLSERLASNRSKLTELEQDLESERVQRVQMMRFVDLAITQAQTDVDLAGKVVAERRRETGDSAVRLQEARQALDARIAAIDQAISAERKAFESSEQYVELTELVQRRTQQLAAAQASLEQRVASNPDMMKAQTRVDDCEKTLKQFRNGTNNEKDIAKASKDWIDAKSDLSRLRQSFLDSDIETQKATDDLRQAQQSVTVLTQAFEASVLSKPAVANASKSRSDAKEELQRRQLQDAALQDSLQIATDALAQRKVDLETVNQFKRDSDTKIRSIRSTTQEVAADLAKSRDAAEEASGEIRAAIGSIDGVDSELDHIADELEQLHKTIRRQQHSPDK